MTRNPRYATIIAGAALALGIAVPAAHAQSRDQRLEKIPLQHIDARIVAAALGLPVLPTEGDLIRQRLQGGAPAAGYGFAPNGGYYGGYVPGYAQPLGGRAPLLGQPVLMPGAGVADPRTNSYLYSR